MSEKIEVVEELGDGPNAPTILWQREIKAGKKFMEKFHKSAAKINERYIDKRGQDQDSEFRVNLFWSTIQVVMSMLYAQPPKADVKRLYDDYNDEPSRVGAEMLQRLLNNDVQQDGSTSNAAIRYAVMDWITVGLGVVWNRYSVDTEMQEYAAVLDPLTGEEVAPAGQFERIVHEDALTEYVHWNDFLYSPARTWEEVRWVARRVYMTREQLVKRFGEDKGKRVPLANKATPGTDDRGQSIELPQDPWQKAEVWEIWDKRTEKVVWYCDGCDFLLDERDDPLGLEDFWPCPPPLIANTTTSAFLPRGDYVMAQDQFEQLDEINTRITWLTRAMKVVGVYDKSAEGVQRMMSQAVENQLIPIDNWAMFAESGGLKNKIDWLPVSEVAAVIEKLIVLREGVKGQIYEVLGISDIMRGNTKASETLGAQQIKAQFGSTRVQLKQFYVAMFVQKALGIKAEIVAWHFQAETIVERSNAMMTPDAEFVGQAIELIKDPNKSKYRVKVQADSLAYIDRKAENDTRTAALTSIGQFMQQASGMVQTVPGSLPYMLEILRWFGAGFKGFQEIEGIMDKAINAANQAAQAPKQPDPMQAAEVAEKKAKTIDLQAAAIQKLADAEAKTIGAMLPFPAPAEAFIGGMPQQGGAPMGQPMSSSGQQMQMPPMPQGAPAPQPSVAQPVNGLPPALPPGVMP